MSFQRVAEITEKMYADSMARHLLAHSRFMGELERQKSQRDLCERYLIEVMDIPESDIKKIEYIWDADMMQVTLWNRRVFVCYSQDIASRTPAWRERRKHGTRHSMPKLRRSGLVEGAIKPGKYRRTNR